MTEGTTLAEKDTTARIRRQSGKFVVIGNDLYRKGYSSPLQKCVGEEEAEDIIIEVHDGICGSHVKTEALTRVLLRQGYFWFMMRTEAKNLVKRCKKCREHVQIQRLPLELITLADYLIPFAVWGIDLIGALPTTPGRLKYCVIAVDYFTKWVEAKTLAAITSENIQKFI